MEELKACPFCGGSVKIVLCDDEGNLRNIEYLDDPYSGVSYGLQHDCKNASDDCPIADYASDDSIMGRFLYDTEQEATEAWNRRIQP